MKLIEEYFELTNKYKTDYGNNTILLMQVGAFFEVYGLKDNNKNIFGSSILDFSKICDLLVVDKNTSVGNYGAVMAGFKEHLIEKYIKKLQDSGFTIVVYAQDENCLKTTRSLVGIFSPGTFFSSDADNITNNICCIWIECVQNYSNTNMWSKGIGKKPNTHNKLVYVGVSVINVLTGESFLFEFNEIFIDNPTTFDELERFISIHNPSETIFIYNVNEKEIGNIVNYSGIKSKLVHYVNLSSDSAEKTNNINISRAMNCEKQIYQKEILEKYFKINDFDTFIEPFKEYAIACQSYCYLLDFVFQHNPNLILKISQPFFENNGSRLILANHSLKQLNIIDDNNYKGKYSSVLKMLNECVTPMGKRHFSHLFLNPITKEDVLNKEYNAVDYLINNKSFQFLDIKQTLIHYKDISKIIRQIFIQKATPKTIYQLYSNCQLTKDLFNQISEDKFVMEYLQDKIPNFENIISFINNFMVFLDSIFDMELCKDIDSLQKIEVNFIKKYVDTSLDETQRILLESEDKIHSCKDYFNYIIQSFEDNLKKSKSKSSKTTTTAKITMITEEIETKDKVSEYVKIHETEKNNFTLVSTDRRCKIIEEILNNKSCNKEKIIYTSRFDNTKKEFELDISKDSIQYLKVTSSNKSIESTQINQLTKNVSLYKNKLMSLIQNVYMQQLKQIEKYQENINLMIDFITNIDLLYCKTYIAKKYNYCKPEICDNPSSFIDAEGLRHCLIENINENEIYISNNIQLGMSTHGILLYGTNAVGKTSFIRSLGIAVIMAQAGLFVPCSRFRYKPYKYIFTRILGNDNLFKGLSTFAVEMSELRTILKYANENSLVLGDELCSGTESISAMSIFVSGIQKLYKVKCSFIFATHLHEIVRFDEITSLEGVKMKHMSVIFDREQNMLIYDRKLKDGPGDNMYGLEVCKSLDLPLDFLENANNLRMKYYPENASMLDYGKSHYNSKKTKGMCENCNKEISKEVHHLIPQKYADENGIIKGEDMILHKNELANLINLCEKCHELFHKTDKKHKKVKTTKGMIIKEV